MSLELQFLNARQGDAIWIRWGNGHQIIVDMGTAGTGTALADKLRALPPDRRAFDLLVVTHMDSDHIGGVLSCVSGPERPVDGLDFADVWFNGWEHLHGRIPASEGVDLEPMGGAQGEKLTTWLRAQAWNAAFDRGPILRTAAHLPVMHLPDGLTLTVLGPTQERFSALIPVWKDEVEAAIDKAALGEVSPGLERMGPTTPPVLESKVDLELLAEANPATDTSRSNGSSITFLLEWEGRRILLTGDAFADDIVDGLARLHGDLPVPLDLIKAPHHGSRQNLSRALVEAVDCPVWVFSTDGTTFRHPDPDAIARILRWGHHQGPTLAFNVPSTFNKWWESDEWRAMFGYAVLYGDQDDGFAITFDTLNDG